MLIEENVDTMTSNHHIGSSREGPARYQTCLSCCGGDVRFRGRCSICRCRAWPRPGQKMVCLLPSSRLTNSAQAGRRVLSIFELSGEFCLARYRGCCAGTTVVTSPAVAAQIAWNDAASDKGCDGNLYRVERPRSMRQCLENGSALHCTLEEEQKRCWRDLGRQQNGESGQPGRY